MSGSAWQILGVFCSALKIGSRWIRSHGLAHLRPTRLEAISGGEEGIVKTHHVSRVTRMIQRSFS